MKGRGTQIWSEQARTYVHLHKSKMEVKRKRIYDGRVYHLLPCSITIKERERERERKGPAMATNLLLSWEIVGVTGKPTFFVEPFPSWPERRRMDYETKSKDNGWLRNEWRHNAGAKYKWDDCDCLNAFTLTQVKRRIDVEEQAMATFHRTMAVGWWREFRRFKRKIWVR